MWGLLTARRLDGWTIVFLASTVATSVTGFIFFPFNGITPGIVIGVISLVVLAVAIVARYVRHLSGVWSRIYAVAAVVAQYLNFFVLIVQSFLKVPGLHELAPTQTEPAFVTAQLAALILFAAAAVGAAVTFREGAVKAA